MVNKFKKLFRKSICKILKEQKLSSDHIIYEEESFENSNSEKSEDSDQQQASEGGKSPKSTSTNLTSAFHKLNIPSVEDINITQ